ncbi:hypothetical protein [Aquimarina sp. 2201CG5-10]|uniref:hypothetical protein n=1 Tax=Aquimarina callyspongiae TaxID=3098150 RepID=UPI002AB49AF7|nr:hypothetical protein [Aquimarina sp. 2201CG5-10]MDY8135678.1 hypothetical protein [Aquimarina sp. 2201CG5-10]
MKDKDKEELLSIQYQIEKSGVKQQKLEDHIASISKELKKRNRNLRIMLFLAVAVMLTVVSFYLYDKNVSLESSGELDKAKNLEQVTMVNDSLEAEITKLKSDISKYKRETYLNQDSISLTNDRISVDELENESTEILISKEDSINKAKKKYERRYCYVNEVFRRNGVIFIEVDEIEYFQGKKAVKKAKENGDAEYDINKNGDTLYFLYNNYYISNKDSKVRILELDDKVRIRNVNQISNGFPIKAFQRMIEEKPILVLEVNNGIVYKITKQRLP